MRYTGIMSAMPEEIKGLKERFYEAQEKTVGGRTYYYGKFHQHPADHQSAIDFPRFINRVASKYSVALLDHFFHQRKID